MSTVPIDQVDPIRRPMTDLGAASGAGAGSRRCRDAGRRRDGTTEVATESAAGDAR